MNDLIAKFRALPMKARVLVVALLSVSALVGGDYAFHTRPAALNAGRPVVISRDTGNGKFGATGDNPQGVTITGSGMDLASLKLLHVANGSASTDGANMANIVATPLSSFAVPTTSVAMSSQKFTSLADGSGAQDSCAFHQINDAVLAGKSVAVDALLTTNQATMTGLAQTVDGIALSAANMRVCLFGQSTVTQDGCYNPASGAWTRTTDVAVGLDLAQRVFTVRSGTANKGTWVLTNAIGSGIVGTNDLVGLNVSGSGGGAVSSVFTRTGAVTAQTGDYTAAQVGAYANTTTLDAITAPAGNIAFAGFKGTGAGAPSAGTTDLATAQWVTDPRDYQQVICGSDFASGATAALTTAVTLDGFQCVAANGTCTPIVAGDANTIGVVQTSVQTSTTAIAALTPSNGSTAGCSFQTPTASRDVIDARVAIPTLSDGTNTFNTYAGLSSSILVACTSAINCCQFNGDSNTDTHWTFKCCSSGTAHCTSTTSTTTITANQYYHLKAVKAVGADSWTPTIDGSAAGMTAVAVDVPTSTQLYPVGAQLRSAGITARTGNWDWLRFENIAQRAN